MTTKIEFLMDDPAATISRENAVLVVNAALPELGELAMQRPEFRPLAVELTRFVSATLASNGEIRLDSRAIEALIPAIRMAKDILKVPMALSRDGGHEGVLASLQTALLSLAATLAGETLPAQEPMTAASLARAG